MSLDAGQLLSYLSRRSSLRYFCTEILFLASVCLFMLTAPNNSYILDAPGVHRHIEDIKGGNKCYSHHHSNLDVLSTIKWGKIYDLFKIWGCNRHIHSVVGQIRVYDFTVEY